MGFKFGTRRLFFLETLSMSSIVHWHLIRMRILRPACSFSCLFEGFPTPAPVVSFVGDVIFFSLSRCLVFLLNFKFVNLMVSLSQSLFSNFSYYTQVRIFNYQIHFICSLCSDIPIIHHLHLCHPPYLHFL